MPISHMISRRRSGVGRFPRLKRNPGAAQSMRGRIGGSHTLRCGRAIRGNRQLHRKIAGLVQSQFGLEIDCARFHGLAASSADHIFMLDLEGTYLFSNDRVSQFGLAKGANLVGRRLQDVYRREVFNLYSKKLQEAISRDRAISFHHQKNTAEGPEYHLDTLFPVHYNGHVHSIGGICCNISEQKNIEKQLFQSQKMEALGALVAGVAHEINNPINLLLFNLPLLEKMWEDLLPVLNDRALIAPDKKDWRVAAGFYQTEPSKTDFRYGNGGQSCGAYRIRAEGVCTKKQPC